MKTILSPVDFREERLKRNLTVMALAYYTKINPHRITSWESGIITLKEEYCILLTEALEKIPEMKLKEFTEMINNRGR